MRCRSPLGALLLFAGLAASTTPALAQTGRELGKVCLLNSSKFMMAFELKTQYSTNSASTAGGMTDIFLPFETRCIPYYEGERPGYVLIHPRPPSFSRLFPLPHPNVTALPSGGVSGVVEGSSFMYELKWK